MHKHEPVNRFVADDDVSESETVDSDGEESGGVDELKSCLIGDTALEVSSTTSAEVSMGAPTDMHDVD